MISSPQQQSSCRRPPPRPRRRRRPLDGGRKMITKTTTRQRHNRRHSSPKSAAVVARTMTMAVVVALCALSFSGVDARKNALSSPREKPPTKKELRENYEVNHPRPFSWAKVPDTSAFDKHVQ